jgi:hypothetical protein
VSSHRLRPDPDKQAVHELRDPRNILELRSSVALLSCFRKFIPDFAKISKPLYDLTRKGRSFVFETPQIEALRNTGLYLYLILFWHTSTLTTKNSY